MLASLLREFGLSSFKSAEDAIQEAFLRALGAWPLKGTPDNPGAWLQTVARHAMIDHLRKSACTSMNTQQNMNTDDSPTDTAEESTVFAHEIKNDVLGMMFACCSATIPESSQIILILKWVSGFSTREIGSAILEKEDTISQRLSRARKRLQEYGGELKVPTGAELRLRLPVVQQAIYLLFNEGYTASHSDTLIRRELCTEAIRLTQYLLDCRSTAEPSSHALMALFCFHAARLDSRVNAANELHLLSEQNRSEWNFSLIERGSAELEKAGSGTVLSRYHLEAGIASCHAAAKSFEETDWEGIVFFYEQLLAISRSPVVLLNYAIALSYRDGLPAANSILNELAGNSKVEDYHLYWAAKADFARRQHEFDLAEGFYAKALELTSNQVECAYLKRRLDECRNECQRQSG
jgi:RNA polymerase sigma-70 factor (ECF subfamily)